MTLLPATSKVSVSPAPLGWVLAEKGLSVFYGLPEAPRLFHYFLPRLVRHGKRVLCFDGANRFDPLLLARFARRSAADYAAFQEQVRVARAFTCFQLTELLARVPRLLNRFAADALIVTALPDLYFDEDIRDGPARASFDGALSELHRLKERLVVAVFSDAASLATARRRFFPTLLAEADHVWKFTLQADDTLALRCEKTSRALLPEPWKD